jgi:hypothetical protein
MMTQQYNPADWIDEICEWIASGNPLTAWCAESAERPSRRTVNSWRESDPSIKARMQEARNVGGHALVDAGHALVMAAPVKVDGKIDPGDVQLRKVQAWYLLEEAKRLNPRELGDKVQQEISGKDGGAIQSEHRIVFVEPAK